MAELGEMDSPMIDSYAMIYIPPGEFVMGVPVLRSTIANSDEKPEHEVFLEGFWIDQTEITNAMFAFFLNAVGNRKQGGVTWLDADSDHVRIHLKDEIWIVDPGYEQHPVVEVSWFGADSYCNWTGKRLPTEAEWEKAARGPNERIFPWGDGISCDLANFSGCIGDTVPVGSYLDGASSYGVYDMAGNAWEWVNDWYAEDYYASSPNRNPTGPHEGLFRVVRGGSYFSVGTQLRTTYREKMSPADSGYSNGFRCASSATALPTMPVKITPTP
jgi:formylglycine-generating enzyme required for sulfatase activity